MQKSLFIFISCILVATGAVATVMPKKGGKLPKAYYDRKAVDRSTFATQRAWVEKTRQIKRAREAFLKANGGQTLVELPAEYKVTGTFSVPVFLAEFANRPAPYDSSTLQNHLFDNNPTGTITDYYNEVSYHNLTFTGTVYDWVQLANDDTYYEGTSNGLGPDAHTGEMIKEILDVGDATIDFGLFDNDGPDGVPNSGDDDGFVDLVSFVHSETGGECGNSNMWTHDWVYAGWPESGGSPYVTNDPAAGGGFIQVNDYSLKPSVSCSSGLIEIGVYCHEYGHVFGLPDLYDFDGPGVGIGWWGIMGSGYWNQPASPAHPCAWTRKELGWVVPTEVTWQGGTQIIGQINTNAQAYKLAFSDDRFRRTTTCAINGSYSLYCGLTEAEGTARGWVSPGPNGGYGNLWRETIQHEFTYSGSGAVSFSYAYDYDAEVSYDFAYAIIDVGGTETVLESYTGTGSGTANHNISPYLSGLSPGGTYTLKFRATSSFSWSDEDGFHGSNCGIIAIDDVSVTGGGENYSTDFETYIDGWHQPPEENPVTEYWLVENRQPVGFDQHLIASGLLIMHVDDEVMYSVLGNSGGSSDTTVRALVVEEADGLFNLIGRGSINHGDTGDPYPGATNNTAFDADSWPNSNDNQNRATQVEVSSISASDATMTAYMKAGDLTPSPMSVSPDVIDNDQVAVDVVVTGSRIKHGATFYFTNPTGAIVEGSGVRPLDGEDIVASSLEWIDPVRLEGTINVYSKAGGDWDLVVTNPDGQTYTLDNAIHINFIVATQLVSVSIEVVGGGVRLEFELRGREEGETIRLYRSLVADAGWVKIEEDLRASNGERYAYFDDDVEPGRTYYYRLESKLADGDVRELHRTSVTIPARHMHLSQNVPNPFNPSTTIRFYLPERSKLHLDIFDVAGRFVARVASGVYASGSHRVTWNGTDARGTPVGSGVYIYRLKASKRTMSKKMILVR